MSSKEVASIREPYKRKLSEQPEGDGLSAKRMKNGEELEEARTNGRGGRQENLGHEQASDAARAAKDKKKRRKKKRKMSVVQQNGVGPPAAAESTSPVRDENKPTSHASLPPSKDSVAGPSSTLRSPSAPLERPVTPGPSSIRQSVTPTGSKFSKEEKGKGRATSPAEANPTAHADAAALTAHRSLLTNMVPSLTCQICLLLMSRPFALAPCGHVSCHACLVSWFSNDPGTLGQAAPPAGQPPPPAVADAQNGEGPAANGNANAAYPPLAAHPFMAPLIRKKKTCPHCRAVVREKPAEVWSIKDMVSAVVRSGLADPDSVPLDLCDDASTADPWKDIFPSREAAFAPLADMMLLEDMGIRDEEDAGIYRCIDCMHEIWDATCTHCGRIYHGHRLDSDSDSQDDEMDHLWMESDDDDNLDDLDLLRRLIEAEHVEHLRAGPQGLHGGGDHPGGLNGVYNGHGSDVGEGDDGNGSDEEEEYESSFIDDDDDDIVEIGPPRQVARRHSRAELGLPARRAAAIVISDDEDDEPPVASMRQEDIDRLGLVLIDSSDEDRHDEDDEEDGDDDDLAAEVAAREQDLYGDDGSLPSRHSRLRGRYARVHVSSDDEDALYEASARADANAFYDSEDDNY